MPREDWKARIDDILEAIARIQQYTVGMDSETFLADPMAMDAAAHNLMILGEAARHVPPEVQARCPSVPWREMRAMRNIIAHQYRDVSGQILWRTVTENLPPLVPLLREILEKEP